MEQQDQAVQARFVEKIHNAITNGDVQGFRQLYIQTHPKLMHNIINDLTGEKTALQRAVESTSPSMVSEILFYTRPELIDYIYFKTIKSQKPESNYTMYETRTPRQIADIMLKKETRPDAINRLKQIKSLLIQNGAKPKTHLGFAVFPQNAKNEKIYRTTRKSK